MFVLLLGMGSVPVINAKNQIRRDDFADERMHTLAGRDALAAALGMTYTNGGVGRATVSMVVGKEHLNCYGTCHGGTIFTLADVAFGLASSSYNVIAPGIDVHITYHVPVRVGQRLIATSAEIYRGNKLAVIRVEVRDESGVLVSNFTGTVFITARSIEESPTDQDVP